MIKKYYLIRILLTASILNAIDPAAKTVHANLINLSKTREVFSLLDEIDHEAFKTARTFLPLATRELPSYFACTPLDKDFYKTIFSPKTATLEEKLNDWATLKDISLEDAQDTFINLKDFFIMSHVVFMINVAIKQEYFSDKEVECAVRTNKVLDQHISYLYKLEKEV